jgi:tRNA A37 threonylcarbamoyltransferase TsaD
MLFIYRRLLGILEKRRSRESGVRRERGLDLVFPPPALCTDNGVMAAWAGIEKLCVGISDEIQGQEVIARWPLGMQIEGGEAIFPKPPK